MADPEVLKATGLYGLHSWATISGYLFGALAGIAALVAVTVPYVAQWRYENELRPALLRDGLNDPMWLQTDQMLSDVGFRRLELDHGLVLFERHPELRSEGVAIVEAVIRRGNQTLAIAQVIALDDRASWTYGSYETMTDGARLLSVEDAVAQSSIPELLARRADDGIDVIAIGIASLAIGARSTTPTQADNEPVRLSRERAVRLASQFRQTVDFVARRPVHYWTLDLGSARTPYARDSAQETRQRAAILVALSRRNASDEGPVSTAEALALITTNVRVYGTDLTDYQNSRTPAAFLSPLPTE